MEVPRILTPKWMLPTIMIGTVNTSLAFISIICHPRSADASLQGEDDMIDKFKIQGRNKYGLRNSLPI